MKKRLHVGAVLVYVGRVLALKALSNSAELNAHQDTCNQHHDGRCDKHHCVNVVWLSLVAHIFDSTVGWMRLNQGNKGC